MERSVTVNAASAPFVVRDAVALPPSGVVAVEGRARRRDAYPIRVTRSVPALVEHVRELIGDAKVALITDRTVMALHGPALLDAFAESGVDAVVSALRPGEVSKSLDNALGLWDWLAHSRLARRDAIVTFGGGVVNDLGGWVASGYMRGLPYLNLPTTVMAQLDAAVGGKVGVNHAVAKNLVGAFYNPVGVVANVAFLTTVDDRHLRAGVAEAIKKAVIASPAYWDFLEVNADAIMARDLDALEQLVVCAAAIKTTLIERDPYEVDLRRPLNFGHTIGHPLETVTGYGPLLHGEAVALGMVAESRIAVDRGLLDVATYERIVQLLRRVGLPTRAEELSVPIAIEAVIAAMDKVRLIRAGSLRYVLPVALGATLIADDVTDDEARRALRAVGGRA
jgi:3-dehydroquinate synthase